MWCKMGGSFIWKTMENNWWAKIGWKILKGERWVEDGWKLMNGWLKCSNFAKLI
jgi:hypothetical protein